MDDADEEVEAVAGCPVAGDAAAPDVFAVAAADGAAAAAPCVCRTCLRGAGLFGIGGSAVALRPAMPDVVAAVTVELVAALASVCAAPFLFGAGLFGLGGSSTEVVAADVAGPAVALVCCATTPLRFGAGLVGLGGSSAKLGPVVSGDDEREVGGTCGLEADVDAVLELDDAADVWAGPRGVS